MAPTSNDMLIVSGQALDDVYSRALTAFRLQKGGRSSYDGGSPRVSKRSALGCLTLPCICFRIARIARTA